MPNDHRSIGELAYQFWQARGCPQGSSEQDWLEAEKQLAEQPLGAHALKEPAAVSKSIDELLQSTFPASDPPATQLPDNPPVNADDKWKAAGVSRSSPARRIPPTASRK